MEHVKLVAKINNVVGYILIATIVLSPIGFIQVMLGYLVLLKLREQYSWYERKNRRYDPPL